MFDTLPETKGRAAVLGRSSVSTSLIAHGGILFALVAISLLSTVSPGPDNPPLPMPMLLIINPPPPLGNSLNAGGGKPARPQAPPKPVAPEHHDVVQPLPPPQDEDLSPPEPARIDPAPEAPQFPADLIPGGDLPSTGGGDGDGSGDGPGDGPGRYGTKDGVEHGTGIPGESDGSEDIYHIIGDVERPVLLRRVEPTYPPIPLRAGIQGTVVLEGVIGTEGNVESIRVLQSVPLLNDAAIRAVTQWRYTPGRMGGRPVKVYLTIRVDFRLH
jgi:protein TonB